MNNVNLIGRLTRDPDVRQTQSGKTVARFTLAVDRGQDAADFIPCQAWDKTAQIIEKHFKKGRRMGVSGSLISGKYDDRDGKTVYTLDVNVQRVDFCDSKNDSAAAEGTGKPQERAQAHVRANTQPRRETPADDIPDGFLNIPEGIDDELPFN